MKISGVALAVILSSLVFSQTSSATANPPGCDSGRSHATSCLATYYGTVYVNGFGSAFIPCLNGGKGENVVFSDVEETIFSYTVTDGKRNGYFMSVGGGMHGKGQTTGINYTARGSTQDSFANWVPTNPDGTQDGEGQFIYTDNYYVNSTSPVTNHIWHRTQRFEETKNGNVYTLYTHPDEVVCY
jgi:hypothetical protein